MLLRNTASVKLLNKKITSFYLKITTMNTANALHTSHNQRLYSKLIYLVICIVYTALFFYAAYILYTGADKMQAYFTGCVTAAKNQLNYCFR